MKLDIYGGPEEHFSASGESDIESLAPCPFCGSKDIVVQNTHTPSYWAECRNCGGEKHGNYCFGKEIKSAAKAAREHTKAFDSAVEAWNTRVAA